MKTFKYIFLLGALLSIASCTDFLDKSPDDMETLDMVFGNKVNTEEWLAGCYSSIPDHERFIHQEGIMADDVTPNTIWAQWGWPCIYFQSGNWNPASTVDRDYWSVLPKRIRSSLIFIQNVKPNEAQLLTSKEVEYMKLEARFLIAYYYTLLVEKYGPVPFNPDKLWPLDTPANELLATQTPFDEIVNWIDNELLEVSKGLPAVYPQAEKFGRATSLMCLAVRSRLLLFAASPLVNGNVEYKGHVNKDGVELFNGTYDASKWTRAAKAAKELIDAAHSAGRGLYKEYINGEIDPFLSYQNMMWKKESQGNKEILFARPNWAYWAIPFLAAPRGVGRGSGLGVSQSLVDAFFMNNGLPPILGYENNDVGRPIINTQSGYSESGFSAAPEFRTTNWTEGCWNNDVENNHGMITNAGTYKMYCQREPRFYVSVLYNGCWYNRLERPLNFLSGQPENNNPDCPESCYLMRKLIHPENNPVIEQWNYYPSILYRLGEAYLNYAEALNESDPGNPDILTYLNLIRERAGIPQYGNGQGMIPAPGTQEEMRDIIRRERRVELCCETEIRHNDIRRWMIGDKTLNTKFYGMNRQATTTQDFYKRSSYQNRVFDKKFYWFPIPQGDMDNNPNLVQSPGWDK